MELRSKKVLITGASGGIGSAIARAFAKEGSHLILNYSKNKSSIKKLEKDLKGNKYLTIQADLRSKEEISKMFDEVKKKVGSLDVLVNVAGIEIMSEDPLDTSKWEDVIKVNLYAPIECSRAALKIMNELGVIINISSIAGTIGVAFNGGSLSYAASKAALNKVTEQLAIAVAPKIRVVGILPGYVLTPMWDPFSEEEKREAINDVPLKRFIQPEEIAQAVVAVASNDAITGQNIVIDGGLVLREIK